MNKWYKYYIDATENHLYLSANAKGEGSSCEVYDKTGKLIDICMFKGIITPAVVCGKANGYLYFGKYGVIHKSFVVTSCEPFSISDFKYYYIRYNEDE